MAYSLVVSGDTTKMERLPVIFLVNDLRALLIIFNMLPLLASSDIGSFRACRIAREKG